MVKINYIEAHRILALAIQADCKVSCTHKSLLEALFFFWNRRGFAENFIVARDDMMSMAKINSSKTYYSIIKDLVELGYITYQPSKNPNMGSIFNISIFYLCYTTSPILCDNLSDDISHTVSPNISPTPFLKQETLNIKQEKEIKISTPPKKIKAELDLTIVPPDFLPAVELWLSYKKEKGKSYKPIGFEALVSELKNKFKNPENLLAAVKFSMGKNWDGIFEEKKNVPTQKNNHHNTGAQVFTKI